MMSKQCADCRDGEHDNYDDDIQLTVVTDPDGIQDSAHEIPKRAYMCREHRNMYDTDGYSVSVKHA